MRCKRNGAILTNYQIELLKSLIKSYEEKGLPICSCDVQRVLEKETDEKKTRNLTVKVSVDLDSEQLAKKVESLIREEILNAIKIE